MSQPGVYVVVRDGSWATVTINTGGYEIHQVTVVGLEVVLAFLSVYEMHHDVGARLADEGALIDIDRRVLMVNSAQLDPAWRLALLEALGRAWPGWEIRWAYRGLDDFAGYPALVDPVPDPFESWRYEPDLEPAPEHPTFYPAGLRHIP